MVLVLFLHLGHPKFWWKCRHYFHRITIPFHMRINLNTGLLSRQEIEYLEQKISSEWGDRVSFMKTENKGCDIGPFFLYMDELIRTNSSAKYVIKLHSKTDDSWMNRMFDALIPMHFSSYFENIMVKQVCIQGLPFMYDYWNMKDDLFHIEQVLSLDFVDSWTTYDSVYPEAKKLNVPEKINHVLQDKEHRLALAPHIDRSISDIQNPKERWERIKQLGYNKIPRLFYFPGTCFLFHFPTFRHRFQGIDLVKIFESLETGKPDDSRVSSKTHSWERVFPIAFQLPKK